MTFLPIVGRELRVASRRRATFWVRTIVALGAIVIGCFVFVSTLHSPPQEFGQDLFQALAMLAMIYCLVAGVRSTADCLSEEKREGTLGLLFLTDLKGYDVVMGKLFATSISSFYGLLAIFPVLAVPLLMGGITNGEFWRMVMVLTNTFLFSLAIGIFVSSSSQSPRKSMAGTFLLMLFFTAGLPLLAVWIPYLAKSPHAAKLFFFPGPFFSYMLSFDLEYRRGSDDFWWSAATVHCFTWVFLLLASLIVPRSWQDKPVRATMQRWRETWHNWSYGDAADRRAFRKRLLDVNAFYWLAGRARLKPAHVWAFLGLIAACWAWGCLEVGSDWFSEPVYLLTGITMNTALKLWVTSEAGRRLGEDRKIGALELLLSTPLTVTDILRGQLLALRRQFLGPVLVVLVVEFTFLVAALQKAASQDVSDYLLFSLTMMFLFVADLIALSWVGMWVALTAKNANRATSIAVVRVLVLPAVAFGGCVALLGILSYGTSSFNPGVKFFLGLYAGLGILADVAFGLSARMQLQQEFRRIAIQRFSAGQGFFSRLFGRKSAERPSNLPPVIAS